LSGIGSCGVKRGVTVRTRKILGGDVTLRARIAPMANMNNPVPVEYVLVYDDMLLETLAKTTAKDWFTNRDQFKQDFPEGFDSWYWEWVPGQAVEEQKLPLRPKASAALVFANYVLPGDNRARLDPYKGATINLGERNFTVSQ
jgi:type VI secretion system protein